MSLYVPSETKESMWYKHQCSEVVTMMLEVFVRREVKLWTCSEIWTLLMECYRDMMTEGNVEDFKEEQKEMEAQYEATTDFFNAICATTGIEDFLFNVDPNSWGVRGE